MEELKDNQQVNNTGYEEGNSPFWKDMNNLLSQDQRSIMNDIGRLHSSLRDCQLSVIHQLDQTRNPCPQGNLTRQVSSSLCKVYA